MVVTGVPTKRVHLTPSSGAWLPTSLNPVPPLPSGGLTTSVGPTVVLHYGPSLTDHPVIPSFFLPHYRNLLPGEPSYRTRAPSLKVGLPSFSRDWYLGSDRGTPWRTAGELSGRFLDTGTRLSFPSPSSPLPPSTTVFTSQQDKISHVTFYSSLTQSSFFVFFLSTKSRLYGPFLLPGFTKRKGHHRFLSFPLSTLYSTRVPRTTWEPWSNTIDLSTNVPKSSTPHL